MKKEKEILAVYDTSELYQAEIEYLITEKENILRKEIITAKRLWKLADHAELNKQAELLGANPILNQFDFIQSRIDNNEDLADCAIEITKRGKQTFEIDHEKITDKVYNDSDLDQFHYDDFISNLDEEVKARAKQGNYWLCEGTNLNWRQASGYKYFQADSGQKLFDEIKPNTSDLTAYFYKGKGKTIDARISHHDCPMGSFYTIKPITQKEYDRNN